MYGFCLRPAEEDGAPNDNWWDCMTVKADLRTESNITTRYVQDGKVGTNDLTTNAAFEAAWLNETDDWEELEAKSNLCTNEPLDSDVLIDCVKFNTHFKRDFTTGETVKDHQLSTDNPGKFYEMVSFVQQYDDSSALWDDSQILADTALNSVSDIQQVTPVMSAFVSLATNADNALSIVHEFLDDAQDAKTDFELIVIQVNAEAAKFRQAQIESELATDVAEAEAAFAKLEAANNEVKALIEGATALKNLVDEAYEVSHDPSLASDAAFEQPIKIEFDIAKEEIEDIRDQMTSDIVSFADAIDVSVINDAVDRILELRNSGNGGNGGDGDGGDGGDGGVVDTDTDEDSDGDDGATSITTLATIVIASVYTLAF